jgi:hypothetical protein
METKIFIGTTQGYERPKSKNKCFVTIELKEGNVFSVCGEIWKQNMSDIVSGGQNLDTLLELFPDSKKMEKIHTLWKRWHLNDMNAGCEHQRQMNWNNDKIGKACPICRYKYGTAWIKEEIPQKTIEEIKSLIEVSHD